SGRGRRRGLRLVPAGGRAGGAEAPARLGSAARGRVGRGRGGARARGLLRRRRAGDAAAGRRERVDRAGAASSAGAALKRRERRRRAGAAVRAGPDISAAEEGAGAREEAQEARQARRRGRRLSAPTLAGGRYRLQRRLGQGGMSTVELAEDVELRRTVAVKLL